eukprot:scaffold28929_cov71-Cyclotella_meneghiniana.AAC.4
MPDPPDEYHIPPQSSRLSTAIRKLEHAESEVDRLCIIIERAAKALSTAREVKRLAQLELDEASKSINNGGDVDGERAGVRMMMDAAQAGRHDLTRDTEEMDGVGRDLIPNISNSARSRDPEEEYDQVYSEEESSEESSEDEDYESEEEEESDEELNDDDYDNDVHNGEEEGRSSPEEAGIEEANNMKQLDSNNNDFNMGNEALDQVRYRLQIAKIDPISAEGTQLLDDLLVRFQKSQQPITVDVVNAHIDELLLGSDKPGDPPAEAQGVSGDPPVEAENGGANTDPLQDGELAHRGTDHPKRIRINRGGKVLGWYQGELDSRGYAREGKGSMYYDAGHECHGEWKNDEMIGRGTYIWADGHKYDGEWENGKRHGLGRFIRPDGVVLYGRYEKGHHRGEGVRWSADRKEAQSMVDGVPKKAVSLAVAEFMAVKLGFEDIPPPLSL